MNKVGVCGHFGEGKKLLNGQTVKTKMLTKELNNVFGSGTVQILDTHGWKKNPIKLLINCFNLIRKCENIIILPAKNGVKVFVPLFLILKKLFFKRKLHYVVIGGWLPEFIVEKHSLINKLKQFDGIYVETHSMVDALEEMGIKNGIYLPNFKRLDILTETSIIYSEHEPYKLCTFSRVMKEKGIEDAINAVKKINSQFDGVKFTLDIYGQIDENYKERFNELQKEFPEYISYKGLVNFDDSVKVLKDYFALLFPTYYEGEGFAGTILDAFAAGVPVIATDWKYNAEIISQNYNGIIYNGKLEEILFNILDHPEKIREMKKNCLQTARKYDPQNTINILTDNL